jgi:hypothetical protein
MTKTVRLTESELVNVIEKFIDKPEMNEQLLKNILSKLFKSGAKPAAKMGVPLMGQLPSKVQTLIQTFPKRVQVGDKLKNVFNTHSSNIKSLEHYLKSQGGSGTANTYARLLSKDISAAKGGVVDLKNIYSNAHMLKKELENIKSAIPVPKQGGVLNKNPNYKKQMGDLYNKFYTETASLNNLISDLEKIKSIYKPR